MKRSRKAKILLAVLVSIALIVSVYSVSAQYVASYIHEYGGTLMWPTPGYTFLPWPTKPTGFVIQVLVPVDQTDVQYYQYVIQTGLLIVLTVLAWVAVIWQALKLRKLISKAILEENKNRGYC